MEDVIEPNRRQGTKERYRGIIGCYIVPHLGGVELAKLGSVHIQTQPPKTAAGRRTVDLDGGTVRTLIAHREAQALVRAMMGESYLYRDRVFANRLGGWVHPGRLYSAVRGYGRRAGRGGSLRHFHASVALQAGQNIVVVSKRLGHATVSTTSDIYAHSLPGWQRQAAEAFAKAMEV